jgi:S1-C subfamily serine protease
MASSSGAHLAVVLFLLAGPAHSAADTLKISSAPAGATVEIDGVLEGTTPFEKDFPGGCFYKTRTSMGSRLEHPMVARISLAGYATKEIQMRDGPMNWISFNGRNHGSVYRRDRREIVQCGTRGSSAGAIPGRVGAPDKPAVVYLKGLGVSGTGFFVTETGVIATNAHVARGEESLLTLLPEGQQLEAKVVYIDADLDIALAKVEGKDFPHLALADAGTVR